MRVSFDPPKTDQDFEDLSLRLLRRHWANPHLQRYAHDGEKQDGVDIFDQLVTDPHRAAQCKLHKPGSTIPPAEIRDEVTKALGYDPPLAHYAILTTAKKSKASDDAVKDLNVAHRAAKKFTVELLTWDRIEELLEQYPDVRDAVYKSLSGTVACDIQAHLATMAAAFKDSLAGPSGDFLDGELDESKRALDEFRPAVVRGIVEKLFRLYPGRMTDRHRWRAKTQEAFAYYAEGDFRRAGRLLLEAAPLQQNDEKARVNEALGHELLGDRAQAHELAGVLRRELPHSTGALAAWVRTAPDAADPEELLAEAGPVADTDDAVAAALAFRFAALDRFDLVERYARLATGLDGAWPAGWLLLGQAVYHRAYTEPNVATKAGLLAEAELHLTRAYDMATAKGPRHLQVAALLTRASVRELAGQEGRAGEDLQLAMVLAPDDPQPVGQYGVYLFLRERYDEAVDAARRAVALPEGEKFEHVLAASLANRNRSGDLAAAIEVWRRIVARPDDEKYEAAVWCLVRGLCSAARTQEARTLIDELPEGRVHRATRLGMETRVLLEEGDQEAATGRAREAAAAVDPSLNTAVRLQLALTLTRLDLHSEVVALLTPVARPGLFDETTRFLLDAAKRTGDDGLTLRLCRELREAGVEDRRVRQDEIESLAQYDPRATAELVLAYLELYPDDRLARLRLALIGRQCEEPGWVTTDVDEFPEPAECHPATVGRAVLHLLAGEGRTVDALRFGYGLLRAHTRDPDANLTYIGLFMLGDTTGWPDPAPGVVGPDTAVCVREVGHEAVEWLVVEDDAPNELLGEYASDHPRVKPILDKRVGDRFTLATGIQERVGEVVDVRSKYFHRFELVRDAYQKQFRDRQDFQAITVVRREPDGSERVDLSPILNELDDRHGRVNQLIRMYRDNPVSVWCLGVALNRDFFEVMDGLCGSDIGLRCAFCPPDDPGDAAVAFGGGTTLVLDLTALYALWRLERLDDLGNWTGVGFVVSQGTFDTLRNVADERRVLRNRGHMTALGGGRYAWDEIPAELAEQRRDSLARLVNWVRDRCRVVGVREVADLGPAAREGLLARFGREGVESLCLAARPDHVLWTDDFFLGAAGRASFPGFRRTWTQMVFLSAVRTGLQDEASFLDVSVRLIGWGYSSTVFDADTLVRAGAMAGWSAERWPFSRALDKFGDPHLEYEVRLGVAAAFIPRMFAAVESGLLRQGVVRAVLMRFADRNAARHLRSMMGVAFGQNGLAAAAAERYIADYQNTSLWVPPLRTIIGA